MAKVKDSKDDEWPPERPTGVWLNRIRPRMVFLEFAAFISNLKVAFPTMTDASPQRGPPDGVNGSHYRAFLATGRYPN